jgi:phage terminase large subunit-like protein
VTTSPLAVLPDVRPRVCSYPPYQYSSGADAIELAELAGLVLDPWQRLVLEHALGERDDGKWSAFEVAVVVARQNGKGAILEARELAGLFLFGEKLILHSAHEYRTAMEAFLRVRALVDGCDDLRRKVKRIVNTNGEEGIELLTGERLRFIARSKGAGRGFSADVLIWDEAYALTEEQVEAQMPVLSARPNAQIWYTSSPPLDAVTGAQLFSVRRRARAGEANTLAYFDWGAEGCLDNLHDIDLDDRDLWKASNPAYGFRIAEEAIDRERAAMSDAGFARERLSIWPPDLTFGFRVIPEQDWKDALDPKSEIKGSIAFGLSAAWDRKTASIGAAGNRRDGFKHVELIDTRPGTGWVVERAVQLRDRWRPCAFVVDPGSPAGSLIPALEDAGIEVTAMSLSDAARAYGLMYDGISGQPYEEAGQMVNPRNVRHLGQPQLDAAVAGATNRTVGDGKAWDLRNATVDITSLDAVTKALYGHALKGAVKTVVPLVEWR